MKHKFKLQTSGNYNKTNKYLNTVTHSNIYNIIDKYAKKGLNRLRDYTPIDSGLAADSWWYDIFVTKLGYELVFYNSDIEHGMSVIKLNEYGHATKDGRWISEIEIVDPAIEPVFNEMVKGIRKEIEG